MNVIFRPARLAGFTSAPASKSEAHRRMICAGLTRGETVLNGFAPSEDTNATWRCLEALGASLRQEGDSLSVRGFQHPHDLFPLYDCGESGSTLRFMVPIAMALTRGGVFRMQGRLSQRPMNVYRDLFVPRGVLWHMSVGADGAAELTVSGSLQAGDYVLPGNVSSQFVSGLLFALPLLKQDSTLTVREPVESASYIRMTVQTLLDSGINVEELSPFSWRIPAGKAYRAPSGPLHGDWSQAGVLLCADALGAGITVSGLSTDTLQGDRALITHLKALGAETELTPEGYTVRAEKLHGATLDLRDCPDIAPILALTCQLAEGDSRLDGCGRLRLKESDRLDATVSLLNELGGSARSEGDSILIHGVKKLRGGAVRCARDHRMVMLAAIAGTVSEQPVEVDCAECLNKSWPDFLDVYRSLGGITQ